MKLLTGILSITALALAQPVDPKIREFLRYILSKQGQQSVLEDKGYLPLTAEIARAERTKLD